MTRRVFVALLAAVQRLLPEEAPSAASMKLLTRVAEALSENNPIDALHYFDRHMSGFDALEADLNALSDKYLIACSIEFLASSANAGSETLQLDWFLQLRSKAENGPLLRRRERVTVTVATQPTGRITAFAPLSILAP
jgi:hypothetical protein